MKVEKSFLLRLHLAHITLGREKDPFYMSIRNPRTPKIQGIPNIDPVIPKS